MNKSLKIYETQILLYERAKGLCENCGKPVMFSNMQTGHKIPQHKRYIEMYGEEVIHHPLNLAMVCSLKCNDAVLLDPKTHPIEAKELIERIKEDLDGQTKR